MMINKSAIAIFVLAAVVIGGNISADVKSGTGLPNLKMLEPSSDQSGDLAFVQELMKRGAYISAAGLLEEMYASGRNQSEVINMLLHCYDELKAFAKSELLLQRLIEAYPFALPYHNKLLEVYLRNGIDSLIDAQINRMLESFPGNPDIFLMIIKELTGQGYYERASELIRKGRERFTSENIFAMEAALLHETRGEYYDAVFEYFKAFGADTVQTRLAERKLSILVRHPGAPSSVITALKDILDTLPNEVYALKMLQEAYIKEERFEEAFDICIRLDSLTEQQGRNIFQYMRQCRERKLYEQVIKAAQYIDSMNYEEMPFADYKFYYAEALVGLGMFDDALVVFNDVFENSPNHRDKAEALLSIGNLYRYHMENYDSARVYYDKAAKSYSVTHTNNRAYHEIALLYLVEGKLDSAETVLSDLSARFSNDVDKQEEVAFQLAMIKFYRKEFEQADFLFRKLIASYPRGYYVNDALINSLIIGESQLGYEDVLSMYAEALYYDIRLMPDSVGAKYISIINMGVTPLIGLSSFKLASFYADRADTLSAMKTIEAMESGYSDDYFYPYSLKLKADILFNKSEIKEAVEIYRSLLENYNNYPFTGAVRSRLQAIDADVLTS